MSKKKSAVKVGQRQFADSEELNRYVADMSGGVCGLAFSCGKDSIAAWLEMRKYFDTIVPCYRYLVPNLEFVEESLVYYEKFFGCRIHRLPHPSLYRMLKNLVFQAPENCDIIERAQLPEFDYEFVDEAFKEDAGLPPETFVASGVRSADSPQRLIAIKTHGPINYNRRTWFAVYDWKKARLMEEIECAGVKLPVDYAMFGRSFDGLDYRFLAPIKQHFPKDFERILEYFPLADLELFRMESRRRYYYA